MSAPNSTSSTASSAPSINLIQPLHNPNQQALQPNDVPKGMVLGKMALGPKGFAMKKLGGNTLGNGQSFNSPTDMMVSPCTQKLVQSKQRHYTKGKPLSLSSSFQSSQLGVNSPVVGPSKVGGMGAGDQMDADKKENIVEMEL